MIEQQKEEWQPRIYNEDVCEGDYLAVYGYEESELQKVTNKKDKSVITVNESGTLNEFNYTEIKFIFLESEVAYNF